MKSFYILILASLFSHSVYSEDENQFDLFNFDRGKPPPTQSTSKKMTSSKQAQLENPFRLRQQNSIHQVQKPKKIMPPQKDFTLKGTSRIGNKRAAILKSPDNQDFIQYFKNNQKTPIEHEKYTGYYLVQVESRKVEIEYPSESPCRNSDEIKGIQCNEKNGGKTATLSLMWDKALAPKKSPVAQLAKAFNIGKKADINEKKKKRQEQYKNFKRKIIEDHEIPEGMRRVRTPFGDRVVPQKK